MPRLLLLDHNQSGLLDTTYYPSKREGIMTGKSLDRMTVNELKTELKNRDLAVTVSSYLCAKFHSRSICGLLASMQPGRRSCL